MIGIAEWDEEDRRMWVRFDHDRGSTEFKLREGEARRLMIDLQRALNDED